MKTAFLPGDREEVRRDVYAEPPQEMRDKLQITREQVLKLETAVCGLRNAPRVVGDLTETGWVQHQLDLCTFMFMTGTERVGLTRVYVDDFLVAGCDDTPRLLRCSVETQRHNFNGERGMSTLPH